MSEQKIVYFGIDPVITTGFIFNLLEIYYGKFDKKQTGQKMRGKY